MHNTPIVMNARFLEIAPGKQILAGNIHGDRSRPDGSAFYSEVIQEIDGDLVRTISGNFRYKGSFH